MKILNYIIAMIVVAMAVMSCSDEEAFSNDASLRLTFSEDTVSFDTVLTTIGSSTKRVRIFNNNDEGIRIANVRLGSGGTSGFRFNVDGKTGPSVDNLEILKNDSIFMFVELTAAIQNSPSPVMVRDSVLFTMESGAVQKMILEGHGQDVIIIRGKKYATGENITLTAEKPYLIYDSLRIDSGATLNIEAGATLFFHSGTSILVYGKLNIHGEQGKTVTLRGDRTDRMFTYLPYDRLDAQWGGIRLEAQSTENVIEYADIHGGNFGIIAEASGMDKEKVRITNSIIHNVSGYGIYSVNNHMVVANTQISNAGKDCVYVIGGDNCFIHCTIAQLYPWNGGRGCALRMANINGDTFLPLERLDVVNSIITGYANDEVFATRFKGNAEYEAKEVAFNLCFDYCLVNTDTIGSSEYFTNCIIDKKDGESSKAKNFKLVDTDNYIYDFRLDSTSLAFGKGNALYSTAFPKDMNGKERGETVNMGAYE